MASLYVIRGKDNGQHFPIRGGDALIGREAGNQIQLHDTEVSRQHARILRTPDGEHDIVDAHSSNGTFVNSRRIQRQRLQSGDRVQVGRTLMIYTGGPEPHPPRPQDEVEIVADGREVDLSNIRKSFDSQHSAAAPLLPGADLRPDFPLSARSDGPSWTSTKNWEIILQVGQAISRTGDLQDLLSQVLDLIFQWIECHRGCIMMLDDVTGQLAPTCTRDRKSSPGQARSPKGKLAISRTILDHVVETREAVLTSNAQDDARWENVESIADLRVREAICAPMLGRYGLVGAIYVDTEMSAGDFAERQGKNSFDEEHLKLMMALAGQAALAIEDTQFYQAMLQSERLAAMGQTIANLSHHVKNILQGVRGGAYLVDDGLKKQNIDVIRKGWGIVQRNQDRISGLVMDMLSFSKDREPAVAREDLRGLISEVYELMHSRAEDFGVHLEWVPPETSLEAEFDHEAMHRAILNVVTNAIDATAKLHEVSNQGRVVISAEISAEENRARVRIEDNGEGIEESEHARIFSAFESTKGTRGTGLGLPVSQKILREHGGDITLNSLPGQGAIFLLQWPAFQISQPDNPTQLA